MVIEPVPRSPDVVPEVPFADGPFPIDPLEPCVVALVEPFEPFEPFAPFDDIPWPFAGGLKPFWPALAPPFVAEPFEPFCAEPFALVAPLEPFPPFEPPPYAIAPPCVVPSAAPEPFAAQFVDWPFVDWLVPDPFRCVPFC